MYYLRAFIAGMILPAVLVPIISTLGVLIGRPQMLTTLFFHWIPIFWGIWNVLYFAVFQQMRLDVNVRMLLTGMALGLLLGLTGTFGLHLPERIGLRGHLRFLPLVVAPIAYALLWRYVVKEFNEMLGLRN